MRAHAPAVSRGGTHSAIAPLVSPLARQVAKPPPAVPTDPIAAATRIGHSLWDVDAVLAREDTAETTLGQSSAPRFPVWPTSVRNRRPNGSAPRAFVGHSPRRASRLRRNRYTRPKARPEIGRALCR